MPRFQSSRDVAFTPRQMFDLVADVQAYPQFLPLCEDLRIRRSVKNSDGLDVLVADMTVGYKAIHETFTSRVTLDRANRKILVEYVDGPFSHLENRWNFVAEGEGARDPSIQVFPEDAATALPGDRVTTFRLGDRRTVVAIEVGRILG